LQTELDLTQGSLGNAVKGNGGWLGFSGTNYLDAELTISTSLTTLDVSLYGESTARAASDSTLLSNLNAEITARRNADSTLQTEFDSMQGALGDVVDGDGAWIGFSDTNYLNGVFTLTNAFKAIDTQLALEANSTPQIGSISAPNMLYAAKSPLLAYTFGLTPRAAGNTVTVGTNPQGIAFDGKYLWIANYDSANVSKVNPLTNAVLATISVGNNPFMVAFDGTNIWVTNNGSGNVSKININTDTVIATVTVGANPRGIAFDGTYIWVANTGSHNVSKVNITTNTVVSTITVETEPYHVCYDYSNIFVSNFGSGTLSKINPSTESVTNFYVDDQIHQMAFDGIYLWVISTPSSLGRVAKVDTITNSVLYYTMLDSGSYWIAFDGTSIWCTSDSYVFRVNPVTNIVTDGGNGNFTHIESPKGICFDGSSLWVTSGASSLVSFPYF